MAIYNTSGQRVIQSKSSPSILSADQVAEAMVTKAENRATEISEELQNPYAFRQVSYPSDITTNPERGHYMLFYVNVQDKSKYKYTGYNKEGESVSVGDNVTTFEKASPNPHIDEVDRTIHGSAHGKFKYDYVRKGGLGNINSSDVHYLAKGRPVGHGASSGLESWHPTTSRITDSIAIYLPANITSELGATYDDATMGMLGFGMASGFDFMKYWNEDDFQGGAEALKGFVGSMGKDVMTRGLAGLADFAETGANTYGAVNKAFSRAINPYMEVIFEKMNVRGFRYRFKFQPKDEKERDDVQEIIKLFRFHMAPELQEGNMRFMGIPATFDIHYMFQTSGANESGSMDWRTAKENSYYNKIATCVLKNVAVDYTPEGVRSFRDGSPTAITMDLSFSETELMTKDKINKGY